jgi:hypothetical protein
MAMETAVEKPTGLDKPSGAAMPPSEPVIHVIPDQFYGAALKKRVPIEAPKVVAAPAKKDAATPAPPPPPKKGGKLALIIIGIVVILAALGATAYFFLFAPKPKPKPPTNVNVNAAAAVCGNGTCESGETSSSCSADCALPAAVCGNGTCESGEDSDTCPGDCQEAAVSVCGDGKCDTDESFSDCPSDCQPPEPVPALDSDSDGLSDVEEKDIYGTNSNNPNTDGDSFVDLNEVLNLFDPTKPPPASLNDHPSWKLYSSAEQDYQILYPAKWTVKESDQGKEVMFNVGGGEFVEVLIDENASGKLLMDWYLEKVPGKRSSEVSMFQTRGGYDEILSDDLLTAYVSVGSRIFIVTYNLGTQTEIRYKATFTVMVNSLKAE